MSLWYGEKGGVYNQGPVLYQQPLYQPSFGGFLPYKSDSSGDTEKSTSRRCCVICTVLALVLFIVIAAIGLGVGLSLYGKGSSDDGKSSEEVDVTTVMTSTTSGPITDAPGTTFTYTLSGRVTINDDVNWPYTTALQNPNSALFDQYENTFCNEVQASQSQSSTVETLTCQVFVFSEGSLSVDFMLRIEETRPSNYNDQYRADQKLQAATSLTNVFVDNTGMITNVHSDSIIINEISITTVTGMTALGDQTYSDDLADPNSEAFQQLEQQFCDAVIDGIETEDGVSHICIVQSMAAGSVRLVYTVTRVGDGPAGTNVVSELQETVVVVLDNTQEFDVETNVITETMEELCAALNCAHTCNDATAVPRCECDPGYTLLTNSHNQCQDLDECSNSNGGCEQTCTNTDGSFECSCADGFQPDALGGTTCIEITCATLACGQTCNDDVVPPVCECSAGYVHRDDGSCEDIDECSDTNGGCGVNCNNTAGSFFCSCNTGFVLITDEVSCLDINECLIEGQCPQECTNTVGSYVCNCVTGFTDVAGACIDVDECTTDTHACTQVCNNVEGSYTCSCDDEFVLDADGHTCISEELCRPWQFACTDGLCVNDTFWCDGSNECPDASDEPIQCRSVCPPNQLQCGSQCIPHHQICDGILHCQDWRDEVNCTCSAGQQQCDMGMCIMDGDWCDEIAHCPDSSDELPNCACEGHRCGDGQCVPQFEVCDNVVHCTDFTDELNCPCDSATQVQCGLGTCIEDYQWCNGVNDCLDQSDETRFCPAGCPNTTHTCYTDVWRFTCLSQLDVCNGQVNCLGASDEASCTCTSDEVECHWGGCIRESALCDGDNNCYDWSDEINCGQDCPSHAVRCDAESVLGNPGDFYCVGDELICDGVTDCPMGEDETEQACNGTFEIECGGSISVTEEMGSVTSPNYPGNHYNDLSCVWNLHAPQGFHIELYFVDFFLEQSTNFCHDLLTINEGVGASQELLWVGCGDQNGLTVTSEHNFIAMVLETDNSVTNQGFNITYRAVDNDNSTSPQGCHFDIPVGSLGAFSSVGYPAEYDNDLVCSWLLHTTEGSLIQITFIVFDIEDSLECQNDVVAVFDGVPSADLDNVIWSGCGQQSTFNFTSTGSAIAVGFVTNENVTGPGFIVQYEKVQDTSCAVDVDASNGGVIASPNFPSDYSDRVFCTWTFSADPGFKVLLNFTVFDIEECSLCGCDSVTLYDGTAGVEVLWKGCGFSESHFIAVSSANSMTLVFSTDFSVTKGGFFAQYRQVLSGNSTFPQLFTTPSPTTVTGEFSTMTTTPPIAGCGGGFTVTAGQGNISSPGYPEDYHNNANCAYTLLAADGFRVALLFTEFDLEECDFCRCDGVQIIDGPLGFGELLWHGCGTYHDDFQAVSSGSILTVIFTSDYSLSHNGFYALYTQVLEGESSLPAGVDVNATTTTTTARPAADCERMIDVSTPGNVTSPGFPNAYPDSLNCEWVFFTPQVGYHVNLTFARFDVEDCGTTTCTCDVVRVYEGDAQLWYGCGFIDVQVDRLIAVSEGQSLSVTFTTDTSITYQGFALFYSQTLEGDSVFPSGRPELSSTTTTTPSPARLECDDNEGFMCDSGACIDYPYRCNGVQDCPADDGSDEQNCRCTLATEFQCADSSACIGKAKRCDGINDCTDYSDEWFCGPHCTGNKWVCETERVCMPDDWLCDGEVDCEGGQDEQNCGSCAADEFQCSTSECIASSLRCDGTTDCTEGADERQCLHLFTVSDTDEVSTAENPGLLGVGTDVDALHAVCATGFTDNHADLACKQLGFKEHLVSIERDFDSSAVPNVQGLLTVSSDITGPSIIHGATLGGLNSCSSIVELWCQTLSCGRPVMDPNPPEQPSKVVNGEVAERESWPWMASLQNSGQHLCGGSIINDRWILTAGHCIVYPAEEFQIRVGSGLRTEGSEYRVEAHFRHPDYYDNFRPDGVTELFQLYNDIALMKLTEPITFDGVTTAPVCLPHAQHVDNHFRRCYVTGWGQVLPARGESGAPERLRQGKMNILSIPYCQQFYQSFWDTFPFNVPFKPPVLAEKHVCAGQMDRHADACFGDSGGPLSCEDEHGNWFVHGIVSSGPTTHCVDFSLYERVTSHLQWIHDVIEAHSDEQ